MLIDSEVEEEVVEEETEESEETETPEVQEEKKAPETLEQKEARLARQLEQTRKKMGKTDEKPAPQTSNEPDYSRLAYLEAKHINHPDDQKLVMDESARLKLPLTDVLQMEHIKARLASNNDARVSQDGMPKGSGRKGGASKSTVDYYLAHPDEIPDDLELHNKVIDARLKKETNSNMFSSTPFVG